MVYFTDWRQGGVVAVTKTEPTKPTVLIHGVDKMYSLKVYDVEEQPSDGKGCEKLIKKTELYKRIFQLKKKRNEFSMAIVLDHRSPV